MSINNRIPCPQVLGMRVTWWHAAFRFNLAILLTLAASTTSTSSSTTNDQLQSSSPECPRHCECTLDRTWLHCSERSFLGLGLGPGLLDVSLHRVQAAEITAETLEASPGLRTLAWTASGIERLEGPCFRASRRLESLNLGDNRLAKLPVELLRPLAKLRELNLTGNRLASLSRSAFQGLEALESLRLADNGIAVLPFQAFEAVRTLVRLDLSSNLLVSLPDHTFRPNRALQELLLSSNRLTKLPSQLFSGLAGLRILELNDNEIDYLPRGLFNELGNLERLDLSGNPLTRVRDGRLSHGAFNGLSNLRWLSLSRSRLTGLPNNLWLPTPHLRDLRLSETRIESLEDGDLRYLRELQNLEIASSPLHGIGSYVLEDTPNLRWLSLRDNDLTFLPPSLAHLSQIEHIELQRNPWACDCRMFWFVRWAEQHVAKPSFDSGLRCGHDSGATTDTFQALRYLNCTAPSLLRATPTEKWLIRTEVVLECEFTGNPAPSVAWITPTLRIFHWNPDPSFPDVFVRHPRVHDWEVAQEDFVDDGRVRLLENGSLYISKLLREDVGLYKCFAINPIANTTAYVTLHMDPITRYNIKLISLAVGLASAVGFLLLTLFVQFLRYLFVR